MIGRSDIAFVLQYAVKACYIFPCIHLNRDTESDCLF